MQERIEVAAQMYTVRQYTQTENDIAKSLYRIKQIGYSAVQVSAFGTYRPEFLRDVLQENGLRAVATHTPYERILLDTDTVIKEHKIAGIPVVGLGYRRFMSIEETDAFLDEILPAARRIRDAGLRFAYHIGLERIGEAAMLVVFFEIDAERGTAGVVDRDMELAYLPETAQIGLHALHQRIHLLQRAAIGQGGIGIEHHFFVTGEITAFVHLLHKQSQRAAQCFVHDGFDVLLIYRRAESLVIQFHPTAIPLQLFGQ